MAGDPGGAVGQRRRDGRGLAIAVTAHPDGPAVERRVEQALARLDLDRKVRLLTGAGQWRTYAEPEIGLRAMVLSDGPPASAA